MLGAARASQYAGWWSNRPPSVTFAAAGDLSYTNKQTPSFSLLTGVGASPANSLDIISTGNFDLTNYDLNTDFNNQRYTIIATIYATWPGSGTGTDFVGFNLANQLVTAGTSLYYNPVIQLGSSNTTFQITSAAPGSSFTLSLSGSYTNYTNRWLTVVWSGSETSASFTNFSATGSGAYNRTAVFDSVTGEFIAKQDYRASWSYPSIQNFPDTTPANSSGSYGLSPNAFGSSAGATYYDTRVSNLWASFGTMFDPLTTTNTSWRTTRPSAVIDTAVAWYNLQMTDYETVSTTYYVKVSDMDLYSQADDRIVQKADTEWTLDYSDTIITTDQG